MLGVRIDPVNPKELEEKLLGFLQDGEQHAIFTPNPEILLLAHKDKGYRHLLNQSALNIPDGTGLVLASLFLGEDNVRHRITGVDTLGLLAKIAAHEHKKCYLLGGDPRIAEQTAAVLNVKYPELEIYADEGGPIDYHDGHWHMNPAIIASIQDKKPDILAVALGQGKQEQWIHDHLKLLPSVSIAIGVGGAFDYISGSVARAPEWMRNLGLEWLFRLILQPGRIRRIFKAVVVFPIVVIWDKMKAL